MLSALVGMGMGCGLCHLACVTRQLEWGTLSAFRRVGMEATVFPELVLNEGEVGYLQTRSKLLK